MKVRRLARRDLPVLTTMVVEFERHLARMEGKRCRIDVQKTGTSLGAAGFGRGRFFDGLLAVENGVAQGYLLYYFGFDTDHLCGTLVIRDFFVRAGARRQGAGRALFQRAREMARARGCGRMEWTVWNINAPAIAFYRAMGAEAVSDELPMGLAVDGKPRPAAG